MSPVWTHDCKSEGGMASKGNDIERHRAKARPVGIQIAKNLSIASLA